MSACGDNSWVPLCLCPSLSLCVPLSLSVPLSLCVDAVMSVGRRGDAVFVRYRELQQLAGCCVFVVVTGPVAWESLPLPE